MMIEIRTLVDSEKEMVAQTAAILVAGFREHHPEGWPDMTAALTEVAECLQEEDGINRIALTADGEVVGWIGGRSSYDGHVWELHPLVVHPDYQGRGVGRLLVQDFEQQVQARGGLTIYLGSDDENDQTSLARVDVYPDPLTHLAHLRNVNRHPFEFYQKMGFAVVGMVPDANGRGKPDIMMAKRVATG